MITVAIYGTMLVILLYIMAQTIKAIIKVRPITNNQIWILAFVTVITIETLVYFIRAMLET